MKQRDHTWADELCARKLKRDGVLPENYRQELINGVMAYANGPPHMKRLKGEEREANIQRLIKLRQRDDEGEETEWKWRKKGVTVTADHNQPKKLSSLKLDFTAEEWADLLNKEGEYLTICCANISRIRDILMDVIREDHEISSDHLAEAAELVKGHGCEQYPPEHPLSRLVALYEKTKKHLRYGLGTHHDTVDLDNPHKVLEALASYANAYTWACFNLRTGDPDHPIMDRRVQDCANREKALIDLWPVVRTLYHRLSELSLPVPGFGLVDEKGEIGYSNSGLAVYHNEAFAQEVCDRWNKVERTSHKKKEFRHTFTVKKVIVSLERGLVIL
jgi:hypothetical protein